MVENVWVEDGDVVISGQTFEKYLGMINFVKWMNKKHPKIVAKYKEECKNDKL